MARLTPAAWTDVNGLKVGHLVVKAHLPNRGTFKSDSYEGDGYITIRHPDTEVVTAALRQIVSTVRVELG